MSIRAKNPFDQSCYLSLSPQNAGVATGQVGEPWTCGITLRTEL